MKFQICCWKTILWKAHSSWSATHIFTFPLITFLFQLVSVHRWSFLQPLLVSGRQQAEKLSAIAGASVLREPGVQDRPLCQKRQTGAGGGRERRGHCAQREKVQTLPQLLHRACFFRAASGGAKCRSENRTVIFFCWRKDLTKFIFIWIQDTKQGIYIFISQNLFSTVAYCIHLRKKLFCIRLFGQNCCSELTI